MEVIKQGIKYGVVGVANTLLTLLIIWLMTKPGNCSETISNLTGYTAGLISSYFLNKQWTFRSAGNWKSSAIRFFGVWAVCYLLQLGLLWLLDHYYLENPPLYGFFQPLLKVFRVDALYYNQMVAMVFYTVVNFFINKFYTFKA
jgi:putative flippase GtrA